VQLFYYCFYANVKKDLNFDIGFFKEALIIAGFSAGTGIFFGFF